MPWLGLDIFGHSITRYVVLCSRLKVMSHCTENKGTDRDFSTAVVVNGSMAFGYEPMTNHTSRISLAPLPVFLYPNHLTFY